MTKIALSICEPSISNLDGKTNRTRRILVILFKDTISSILLHILQHHPVVIISMDVVKINGIPFLSTISRIEKLGTCTELLNTKIKPL